jgi:GntR family hexuronate regulon transcriptional repressor
MSDRRMFEDVAEQILQLIKSGLFQPGTRLPGERELSERFGVSRVTIREAEIALQAMGWIKIKTGAGVYVLDAPTASKGTLPVVSAFELTEARSLFEAESAALAASTITEEELARLDVLLDAMADDSIDDDKINEIDREFHLTIARASKNQAIIHVIETLWRFRLELPDVRASHSLVCRKDGEARRAEHAEIVEALKARDAARGRIAMRRHFSRLLESMISASEERELDELRRKSAESRARFLISASLG